MVDRLGECLRCGKCCDHGDEGWPCEHLEIANEGMICAIYEDRPEVCRKFPEKPVDLIPGCGYYFKVTND